jgi:hypothetical protein
MRLTHACFQRVPRERRGSRRVAVWKTVGQRPLRPLLLGFSRPHRRRFRPFRYQSGSLIIRVSHVSTKRGHGRAWLRNGSRDVVSVGIGAPSGRLRGQSPAELGRVAPAGEIPDQAPDSDLGGQTGKAGSPALREVPGSGFLVFRRLGGGRSRELLVDPTAAELALDGVRRKPAPAMRVEGEACGEALVALQAGLCQPVERPIDRRAVEPLPGEPGSQLDPRAFSLGQQPERGGVRLLVGLFGGKLRRGGTRSSGATLPLPGPLALPAAWIARHDVFPKRRTRSPNRRLPAALRRSVPAERDPASRGPASRCRARRQDCRAGTGARSPALDRSAFLRR